MKPIRANILPPVTFDLMPVEEGPFGRGKPRKAVMLPPVTFDLTSEAQLRLRLDLRLKAGAMPGAIARDMVRLFASLNDHERSLGGMGLVPLNLPDGAANGAFTLTFLSVRAIDADQRLKQMIEAINAGGRFVPATSVIEWCQASAVSAA